MKRGRGTEWIVGEPYERIRHGILQEDFRRPTHYGTPTAALAAAVDRARIVARKREMSPDALLVLDALEVALNDPFVEVWDDPAYVIRAERTARNWSQAELASRAGLDRSAISKIESRVNVPRTRTVRALRKALKEG